MGEGIFAENCQTCHGPEGLGDGPAAAGLTPPPANLAEHVLLHSDKELFNVVSVGVPETAMPPFGHLLNEEDRWHLINYLRVLTAEE